MSDETTASSSEASETKDAQSTDSLLDQIIKAIPHSPEDDSRILISNIVDQALENVVVWDRNVTQSIEKAIEQIDESLSNQMSEKESPKSKFLMILNPINNELIII